MSSSACALVGSKLLKIQIRTAPDRVLSMMKVCAASTYDRVFTVPMTVHCILGVHEKLIHISNLHLTLLMQHIRMGQPMQCQVLRRVAMRVVGKV